MLISRFNPVVRSTLHFLALSCLAFVAMPLASAGEKATVQVSRHKTEVKKRHQRVAKIAKPKKAASQPHKTAAKTGGGRKTASKSMSSSLKLSRDIESSKQGPSQTASPKPKQFNQISPKPSQDINEPPLQIGKTLYQRNGEIRQLETE